METIKVHIAGRDYPLQAPAAQVERIKQAADEVNKQFEAFKDQFALEDAVDLLAMTALHFASEDAVHKREQADEGLNEPSPSAVQHLDELSKRIQTLLEV
jgi:cell division protein ZapA